VSTAEFAAGAHAKITADTDNATFAQIDLSTKRSRGRLITTREDVGVVTGHRRTSTTGPWQDFVFENYLQDAGVRPGINSISITLGGNELARGLVMQILPDSGVEVSAHSPTRLVVQRTLLLGPRRVGSTVRLRLWLHNAGGSPARNTTSTLLIVGGIARPVGPTRLRIPVIPPGATVSVVFRIKIVHRGSGQLGISGGGNSNTFATLTDLVVK
jgi:hypothetical protein